LLIGLLQEAVLAQQINLVRDGSFEVAKAGHLPPSWKATGAVTALGVDARDHTEGTISVTLKGRSGQATQLSQEVVVKPDSSYLFSADVRSEDRVVAQVSDVAMSYHQQGQWERLTGLIRTGNAKTITLTFNLTGLSDKPPMMKVDAVSLHLFQHPATLQRRFDASTTFIVKGGKPTATIVYPSYAPEYKALAERLRDAIAKKTGISLPIVSDVDATKAGPPILKGEIADQNLILIGHLGINRAIWPAYNRFLAAADGYYPGGDGYVVRTAANVMRNGKNQIILGGSSEAGAARAVDTFIQMLKDLPSADGSLELPWLLKTDLQGQCLAGMKAHDAKWVFNPLNPSVLPNEPGMEWNGESGYGTVRRWYENAMGYYWTGWDSYKERAKALIKPILKDQAYTTQYVAEFMVRTYDMIDDSDLLTPQERAGMDQLILSSFCDYWTPKGDLSWMTTFSPPYEWIQLENRHQIAPWMSDLKLAQFLRDYFQLEGDVKALVDFRWSEKDSFMRHLVANSWDSSLPGIGTSEHDEEIKLSMLRYALDNDDYTLFESGHARRLLGLAKINQLTGAWVRPVGGFDSRLILGTLASYYHDGRYLSLMQKLRSGPPFMNRYLGGVRDYTPGSELKPADLDSFTGVRLPPMTPQRRYELAGLGSEKFQEVKFPPSQAFDFASFRSGFDPGDDYVALNGLQVPGAIPGIFMAFTTRGMNWLGNDAPGMFAAASDRYFDRNGVYVSRTDKWQGGEKLYAAAARLDWSADLHRGGGVAFTCDPFSDMSWQRSVVWVRPGLYIVRDQLTASESGKFQITVNWRPAGGPSWDGKTWTSISRTGNLRLTPLGNNFHVHQNAAEFVAGTEKNLYLRNTASASLKTGESVVALTALQGVNPGEEPALSADLVGENAVYLAPIKQSGERVLVAWHPKNIRGVNSDAQVVVLDAGKVQVIDGTRLEIDGKTIMQSERPISLLADFAKGTLRIDNPASSRKQSLRLIGPSGELAQAVEVDVGARELSLPEAPSAILDLLSKPLSEEATAVAAAPAQAATTAPSQETASVRDVTSQWRQTWRYDGLRQPMLVSPVKSAGEDVVDLGRVVDLAGITPKAIGRFYYTRPLPAEIWVAAGDASGNMPSASSADWKKITQPPEWRPSANIGNYGETHYVAHDSQILHLTGIKARYVRAKGVENLVFFDGANLGSHQPLMVQAVKEGGKDQLFVYPRIWPKFLGTVPYWDDKIAMLTPQGKAIYSYTAPTKLMDAQLLPLGKDGGPSVVLATIEGKIQVLDSNGAIAQDMDLHALQQEFNHIYGHPNTRHPAGGFVMPFSVGAWRQSPGAAPTFVVARYHSFSFLDSKGKLEGVLSDGSYVQPAMLPMGIDFNGDGAQEQICVARGNVIQVYGPQDKRVEEPNGFYFYPQVYHIKKLGEPAWDDRLDGAPILAFEPIQTGRITEQRPRYIVIAREQYIGVYDGLEKKWAFTWAPLVPLRAAAVVEQDPRHLRILAAAEDNSLWDLHLGGSLEKIESFNVNRLPDTVNQIAADPSMPGTALLAANHGLYRLEKDLSLTRLAKGAFVDVLKISEGVNKTDSIVAVTRGGSVRRLDRTASSSMSP
jgi:hypothetical protein